MLAFLHDNLKETSFMHNLFVPTFSSSPGLSAASLIAWNCKKQNAVRSPLLKLNVDLFDEHTKLNVTLFI